MIARHQADGQCFFVLFSDIGLILSYTIKQSKGNTTVLNMRLKGFLIANKMDRQVLTENKGLKGWPQNEGRIEI